MQTSAADNSRTAIPATPPPGFERETPKYRVIRETFPAEKARFRTEPPFASASDASTWQYGERILKAGEIVETRDWPHPLFFPLNYAAKKVLDFFNSRQKSRLPRSPYDAVGQLRLDDGLIGTMPKIVAPQVQPIGMPPAGGWPRR
jgi:hypothetical protein